MEFRHESFAEQQDSVHTRIEKTLAKLRASVTVTRAKEPPDPVATPNRGWSIPPSVVHAPFGINPYALPRLRLDPPRFDGENARDWICKIQQYYNHHYTPLDDRLYLTQFLFDHPASDWREYWEETNKGKSWEEFLLAVDQRFNPEFYTPYATTNSPGLFMETRWTGQDHRQPNQATTKPVAYREADKQPPHRNEEVKQLIDENMFGAHPLSTNESSPEAVIQAVTVANRHKADIEDDEYDKEKSAQVHILLEADLCTKFQEVIADGKSLGVQPSTEKIITDSIAPLSISTPEAKHTNVLQTLVASVAAESGVAQVSVAPEGTVSASMLSNSTGFYRMESPEDHMYGAKPMDVEEEGGSVQVDTKLAADGPLLESDKVRISNAALFTYAGLLMMKQSGYLISLEKDGCSALKPFRCEIQVLEDTGICEESRLSYGVDQSSCSSCFEPKNLIEFIKGVAQRAFFGADGLDLAIDRAQLYAFCYCKGYRSPPELFTEHDSLLNSLTSNEMLEIDKVEGDGKADSRTHRPTKEARSGEERSSKDLTDDRECWPVASKGPVAGMQRKSKGCWSKNRVYSQRSDRVPIFAKKTANEDTKDVDRSTRQTKAALEQFEVLSARIGLKGAALVGGLSLRTLQCLLLDEAHRVLYEDFQKSLDQILCEIPRVSGLDIPSVDAVINYDIPTNSTDYIHRVDGTARAERSGVGVLLVNQYEAVW